MTETLKGIAASDGVAVAPASPDGFVPPQRPINFPNMKMITREIIRQYKEQKKAKDGE